MQVWTRWVVGRCALRQGVRHAARPAAGAVDGRAHMYHVCVKSLAGVIVDVVEVDAMFAGKVLSFLSQRCWLPIADVPTEVCNVVRVL